MIKKLFLILLSLAMVFGGYHNAEAKKKKECNVSKQIRVEKECERKAKKSCFCVCGKIEKDDCLSKFSTRKKYNACVTKETKKCVSKKCK